MALPVELVGRIRGMDQPGFAQNDRGPQPLDVNPRGDLAVVQALPSLAEVVRMGESYFVIQAAAVAPVVALPTTTAQVSLWNGEPDGGRCYVIDSVFATDVVSAGAATGIGLAALLNIGRVALPSGSLLTPKGLTGQGYRGAGKVVLAATVVDDTWAPLGSSVVGPASQIGLNLDVPVNGLYIVRPGHLFSLACLANTVTTITVKMGIRWHEVNLVIS